MLTRQREEFQCLLASVALRLLSQVNPANGLAVACVIALLLSPSPAKAADKPTSSAAVQQYGNVPLHFEANQGQTDPHVKFISRGPGYTLSLTAKGEAVLLLSKAQALPNAATASRGESAEKENKRTSVATMVRMSLVASNRSPAVTGVEKLAGKANYLIGDNPDKWLTNIATFAKVQYDDVYRGIDLVYYGNQRQLEYDFIVAPGADPRAIKLRLEGAEKLSLEEEGDLVRSTDSGEIRFHRPLIYQEVDGNRREIAGGFALKDSSQVGFEVGAYDAAKPLVIDPTLTYSTYLGGNGNEAGNGIAVDSSGSAYVTGLTCSSNFPTTAGAFQTTIASGYPCDAFVSKLNANGTGLVYSTYLGGNDSDIGHAIAVDSLGSAYVTGETCSSDFPTTAGAFQTTNASPNCTDAFVSKLNANGDALVYSTYLGGNGFEDVGHAIAVDASSSAHVSGGTCSTNFPTTAGAFQTTHASGNPCDAFVSKLNANGTGLVYSTYLGGIDFDVSEGIALDSSGSAYVTGNAGRDLPTTPGVFQTAQAGIGDAFVTKLNANGTGLVYSTYLGGNDFDIGEGIAVDSAGSAYVAGEACSSNFPTTAGAFQTTIASGNPCDAFVSKLNANGTGLVYSTYLGGNEGDGGRAMAVDSSGSAYVTGETCSSDFPTTAGAFQTINATTAVPFCHDSFVSKFDANGDALVYSTYLGGNSEDEGHGIAVDSAGSAYVTGVTFSTNFPTTAGAFQTTDPSTSDVDSFIAKIGVGLTSTLGKVTGGGVIQPDGTVSPALLLIQVGATASIGNRASFGFNVRFTGGGNPTGNLTYYDDASRVRIKALSFSLLVISDGACGPKTHARFTGSATVNRPSGTSTQDFEAEADDCGQAGSVSAGSDRFRITTLGAPSYAAAGPVVDGNVQIHKN